MDFREMAQEMILCALNCGLSSSSGVMYKKAVKRELIGQYAETFWLNGEEKKFYGTFNKKEAAAHPWDVILVSTKFDVSKPYYEHIEPISYTYSNLCSLKSLCIQNVKDCMRYCKIAGITKEQSAFLDKKGMGRFSKKDEEVLNRWRGTIGNGNYNEAIGSMKDSGGNWLRTQENGTAYARLAHLAAHGVEFVWAADPKPYCGKPQEEIIKDYLENTNYKYKFNSTTRKWI